MELFDNTSGFKPKGTVLKFWTLLPQVSTTIGNKHIPSLFGNLRSISLYYLLVATLIFLEVTLVFYLNDEGIPPTVFISLSIADFFLVILPSLIHLLPKYNDSVIDANIFIAETKLAIKPIKIPQHFNNNEANYNKDIYDNLKKFKSESFRLLLIKLLISGFIISLGVYKFASFWGIYGRDIFYDPIGRFTITSIFIGILVHLFCTKIVFYHIAFKIILEKQKKDFHRSPHGSDYRVMPAETNKPNALNFDVPFNSGVANKQKIYQEVNDTKSTQKSSESNSLDVKIKLSNDNDKSFRTQDFQGNASVYLIFTGLLLESEIDNLYTVQDDSGAKQAVIAASKEIQISQIG